MSNKFTQTNNNTVVYFMQQGETGPIKIGVSEHPQTRRKRLQTGSPHELRIIHTFVAPDDNALENGLHSDPVLEDAQMKGEWFSVPEKYQDPRLFILRQPWKRVLFPCFHCEGVPGIVEEEAKGTETNPFRVACDCGASAPKVEGLFRAVLRWNRMMEML